MFQAIFISIMTVMFIIPQSAMAVASCAACSVSSSHVDANSTTHCTSYTTDCKTYDNGTCNCGYVCTSCDSGYSPAQTSVRSLGTGCTISYASCTSSGSSGGGGSSDTCTTSSWLDVSGTNYQSRQYCSSMIATPEKQYRCQKGYYGNTTDLTTIPTCTSCATGTGNSAATSIAGTTSLGCCYIPSGSAFTDDAGSGTVSAKCYYSSSDFLCRTGIGDDDGLGGLLPKT